MPFMTDSTALYHRTGNTNRQTGPKLPPSENTPSIVYTKSQTPCPYLDLEISLNDHEIRTFIKNIDETIRLETEESDRSDFEKVNNMSMPSTITDFDEYCMAVPRCITKCGSHRKVTSHLFGRNKSQTKQMPEYCFPTYCRKHYQRLKFRCEKNGTWVFVQVDLVGKQLDRLEDWGHVDSWNVVLHKGVQDKLNADNAALAEKAIKAHNKAVQAALAIPRPDPMKISSLLNDATAATTTAARNTSAEDSDSETPDGSEGTDSEKAALDDENEQILLPYLGNGKSFEDLRYILDLITDQAKSSASTDKKARSFPGIEFLPNIDRRRFPPNAPAKAPKSPKTTPPPKKDPAPSPSTDSLSPSSSPPSRKRKSALPRPKAPVKASDSDWTDSIAPLLSLDDDEDPVPSPKRRARAACTNKKAMA